MLEVRKAPLLPYFALHCKWPLLAATLTGAGCPSLPPSYFHLPNFGPLNLPNPNFGRLNLPPFHLPPFHLLPPW